VTELKVLIKNEYDRAVKYRSSKESFAMLYSGQTYTDEYLINNFPIKYKVEERLAQLKSLLFFLASTNNIHDVKENKGIFFTKDTFAKAGISIGNPQTMHNWVEGLKRCGLVYVINNHYQFGHGDENFSKLYGLNQCGIVRSWPKEYHQYLETHSVEEKPNTVVDISKDIKVEVFDKKQKVQIRSAFAKFNQNLVYNFNKDSLVEFTKGTIDDFEKMLNEYNEGKNEFNKKVIRFKCDRTKISGRAYSQYIKTEKDDIENGYTTDRTDWCKENNLAYRYDIKSAVPRISHLMNTGTWKNEDFDFYEYMSKRMSEDSGMYLPRDYMKEIHMRLRFGQSPEKSFNDFCYSNRDIIRARYGNNEAYESYLTNVRPNLLLDWRKLYNIVEELEGTDHSSAVFYFESFLELYVVWRLKQLGVTAYNIYDEFFYDKPYDIASIIEEGANYMYQKTRDYDDRFNIGKRSI